MIINKAERETSSVVSQAEEPDMKLECCFQKSIKDTHRLAETLKPLAGELNNTDRLMFCWHSCRCSLTGSTHWNTAAHQARSLQTSVKEAAANKHLHTQWQPPLLPDAAVWLNKGTGSNQSFSMCFLFVCLKDVDS